MELMNKWEPIPDLSNSFYLDNLIFGKGGLKIFLKSENEKYLKIHFKNFLGFRSFDESYRLKSLSEQFWGESNGAWTFFIATNDELIRWVNEETYGIFENVREFKNYIIATPDDIIEIVSDLSPNVEWVDGF